MPKDYENSSTNVAVRALRRITRILIQFVPVKTKIRHPMVTQMRTTPICAMDECNKHSRTRGSQTAKSLLETKIGTRKLNAMGHRPGRKLSNQCEGASHTSPTEPTEYLASGSTKPASKSFAEAQCWYHQGRVIRATKPVPGPFATTGPQLMSSSVIARPRTISAS